MADETTKESPVAACAKAFPGLKASFADILEWRQHPGYMAKNDPFINGQIAQTVGAPAADANNANNDEEELERTPAFELSRKLDEAMRDVYKHLHDTFVDTTVSGQELELGRAYTAITKFQTDNSDNLTSMQTAAIACTRDQIARYQVDLSGSKAKHGKPLSVSMELLEESFSRMNQWRPDDDPMKTMTLKQYIDKGAREKHAAAVAAKPPPSPKIKTLASGINVDVTSVIMQIEELGRKRGGFGGKGLFFGIDYSALCLNGDVMPGKQFITCKTEEQWRAMEPTFCPLQLVATVQKLPGEQDFFSELTDVRHDGLKLVVQYFVIELDDRRLLDNPIHNDARAQLLPEVLSGKGFNGQAVVQVWAHIKQLDTFDKARGQEADGAGAAAPAPSTSTVGLDTFPASGYVEPSSVHEAQWSEPHPPASGLSTLRHESTRLMQRAKALAELGDHKTAYEIMAQGYALRQRADENEAFSESCATSSPAPDEPMVYKPEVKYEYPSGEVRTIEAGYFTETDHLARSMEEQELLNAVKVATALSAEKSRITPEQMSKYSAPLSRTESQADAMTGAEKLAPVLRDLGSKTRFLMSSKEGSKQASPEQSPQLPAGRPPSPAPRMISMKLPDVVLTGCRTAPPELDFADPGPSMDELGYTDAQRDYHECS